MKKLIKVYFGIYCMNNNHEIIYDTSLDLTRVNLFLAEEYQQYPPFTKLHSASLVLSLRELIEQSDVYPVHLPTDECYHLEFMLCGKENIVNFVYTTCEECESLEKSGLPQICLRQSVKLPENQGSIMYDNRISVNHMDRERMIKSYEAMNEFVDTTRIN